MIVLFIFDFNMKSNFFITPSLYIAPSHKKGRGVFTLHKLAANTIIEVSPVILLTAKERKIIEETHLYDYIFEWGETRKSAALGLGYVSLYNHDYNANCDYTMDFQKRTITIHTVMAIKRGEELYINYNANPTDTTPVWFDPI